MAERIESLTANHLGECDHLLMSTFNAQPWNDGYTLATAKEQLVRRPRVPGCLGLVSISDGIVAFAIGYVEPTDVGDVYQLSIFCVKPDAQRTGVGTRLLRTWKTAWTRAGKDHLPRDAQGNARRGFIREARLRVE